MCLKLRTVAASNNRDHTPRSLYYCLFAPRICGVVLRANSVRGEPHIQRNVSGVVATTETSYSYVHIVLALRLPGVTVGYYISIFAFLCSVLNCCGVSRPSSDVAMEIRISQEPQSF